MKNLLIALFTVLMTISSVSFAQELLYPELNVTPRASERIKLEIRDEAGSAWSSHMAIQASGLMTLAAGAMAGSEIREEKVDGDIAPTIAMGIGALWLGATAWAAASYRPYRRRYNRLRRMPYKTKRQKLTVERLAEEEINALALVGKRLRWFSAFTNLAASAFLIDNVNGKTDAYIAANFAALMSLSPLFIKYHWETVAEEQKKYKKKIFSPVAIVPIFKNPITGKSSSGVSLVFSF